MKKEVAIINNIKPIHTIGVVLRPAMPSLGSYYREIKKIFIKYHIIPILDQASAEMIGAEGMPFKELLESVDLLMAIGGDGTLLALIRRSYGSLLPVIGINMGRLGFLAEIRRNEVEMLCDSLVSGNFMIQEALMLEGEFEWSDDAPLVVDTVGVNYGTTSCIYTPSQKAYFFAFNEFTLMRSDTFGMIYLNISIIADNKQKSFNSFGGDGLIVSTPHGSTAYNISAGGPVVYPFSENIILTPICAHSLTQCPLVLSSDFQLGVELLEQSTANLIIDGQRKLKFHYGDKIIIRKAKHSAAMLHTKNYDYFAILREKFRWG